MHGGGTGVRACMARLRGGEYMDERACPGMRLRSALCLHSTHS